MSLLFFEYRVIDIPTLRKVGNYKNEKLYRAIEDFITQRMDDLGADAPAYVAETITEVGCCAKKLEETLMESQFSLWRELEDALSRQTGEEMRYYYRAGFHDAVRFLLGWNDRT